MPLSDAPLLCGEHHTIAQQNLDYAGKAPGWPSSVIKSDKCVTR